MIFCDQCGVISKFLSFAFNNLPTKYLCIFDVFDMSIPSEQNLSVNLFHVDIEFWNFFHKNIV